MGNCDSDFAHKNDHSFFENHHRDLVRVSFCKKKHDDHLKDHKKMLFNAIKYNFFIVLDF